MLPFAYEFHFDWYRLSQVMQKNVTASQKKTASKLSKNTLSSSKTNDFWMNTVRDMQIAPCHSFWKAL